MWLSDGRGDDGEARDAALPLALPALFLPLPLPLLLLPPLPRSAPSRGTDRDAVSGDGACAPDGDCVPDCRDDDRGMLVNVNTPPLLPPPYSAPVDSSSLFVGEACMGDADSVSSNGLVPMGSVVRTLCRSFRCARISCCSLVPSLVEMTFKRPWISALERCKITRGMDSK